METIFASASSAPKSAIKIIRVSGNDAKKIPKIFSFAPTKPRVASLRKIYGLNNEIIDNALIIFYPGPKTVTGEDLLEFHIHGSYLIEKKIYDILGGVKNFRIAERGEFTKRAFLNGILDLTQAEGLNDIINSETEIQLKQSMSQYEGSLSNKIYFWRNEIIYLMSKLEALIDFSDEDLPLDLKSIFKNKVSNLLRDMENSILASSYGQRIRNGFVITLIGRPNVGKSTLINHLSNKKLAIVTDIPGTTRDVLEVMLDLDGFPVVLNDTAGIRKVKSVIEKIGIQKALEKAKASDIVLVLSDNEEFSFPDLITNAKKIFVHTKSDLKKTSNINVHNISVKKNIGIDDLIKNIVEYFKTLSPKESGLLTRNRHIHSVKNTTRALTKLSKIDLNTSPELASEELRIAAKEIGNITNYIDVEEILDDIFKQFCIGK